MPSGNPGQARPESLVPPAESPPHIQYGPLPADIDRGLMDEDQPVKLTELKDRVRRGEYRVDPRAVAEAILRGVLRQADPPAAQNEC